MRLLIPLDMAALLTIISPTWAHSAITIPAVGPAISFISAARCSSLPGSVEWRRERERENHTRPAGGNQPEQIREIWLWRVHWLVRINDCWQGAGHHRRLKHEAELERRRFTSWSQTREGDCIGRLVYCVLLNETSRWPEIQFLNVSTDWIYIDL